MIGIVGGVGPYAGLDLARKIFDQTVASGDRDHLPVALLSVPGEIADRTEFLLGKTETNPAHALSDIVLRLERMGASVVGIPCNTAHAPSIFDVIARELETAGCKVRLVHMIEAVAGFVRRRYPRIETVGLLCTTGTYGSGIYPEIIEREGLKVVQPDESLREDIHAAIYDQEYGIKARPNPVTGKARDSLLAGVAFLQDEGAGAVILGCSEIPIAIAEKKIGDTPMIDPTLVLARALIKSVAPDKLKPCGESPRT